MYWRVSASSVEILVRFGAREREVVAVLDVPLGGAGIDLDHHVVEVGFRPQQQAGVGVDQFEVLGFDVHADDGVAVLEVDRGDLADLDAGDVDGLALARRHRLGGGEVAADVDEFFADQRQPGRQRGLLLGEDPERHHDPDGDEDEDRDRVLAAPARLAGKGRAEMRPATHGLTAAGVGAPT
jgi:hypothetical protein